MAQIDMLTRPQRQMLDDIFEGQPLNPRGKSTRDVLLRYGFIAYTDNGLFLTETGEALYEEDGFRANTVDMFAVGDTVHLCEWHGGNGKPYQVNWEPVKVLAVGKARVKIQLYENDETGTWREPRRLRPQHVQRFLPLEVQASACLNRPAYIALFGEQIEITRGMGESYRKRRYRQWEIFNNSAKRLHRILSLSGWGRTFEFEKEGCITPDDVTLIMIYQPEGDE